jgi:hypothetical protein
MISPKQSRPAASSATAWAEGTLCPVFCHCVGRGHLVPCLLPLRGQRAPCALPLSWGKVADAPCADAVAPKTPQTLALRATRSKRRMLRCRDTGQRAISVARLEILILRGEKRRHFSGSRVSHLFFAVHALVNRREAMQVRHALHYCGTGGIPGLPLSITIMCTRRAGFSPILRVHLYIGPASHTLLSGRITGFSAVFPPALCANTHTPPGHVSGLLARNRACLDAWRGCMV